MRKSVVLLAAVFTIALAAGFYSRALAAPLSDSGQADQILAVQDVAPTDALLVQGRRLIPPRLRPTPCRRLALKVARECPCRGPRPAQGEEPRPWKDHQEYVSCVTKVVDEVVAEHENLAECGEKIKDRAAKSKIGEEGFRCPPLKRVIRRLPRLVQKCTRVVRQVHQACPCEGPVGEDRPWASQEEFLECVRGKLAELGDAVPEKCATLILARAEKSGIGQTGYTCPPLKRQPEP